MREQHVYVQAAPLGNAAAVADAVEHIFTALPAAGRLTPESRVLIKPNLLAAHEPACAVTTHPHVLRGVILALQKRGVQSIVVADSPGGFVSPANVRAIFQQCGVQAVCDELGATAWSDCESIGEKAGPGSLVRRFTLIEPALSCDFIVNLPKLKTHVLTGLSGAVKNLFGCVPGLRKTEFHMRFPDKEDFGQMLADLCETVQADIHIVDALLAMEGDGPGSGGTPRQLDMLLGSEDPYQLDLALCRYINMPPAQVPYLAAAMRQGLCPPAFDPALLVCEAALKAPIEGFCPPRTYEGKVDFSINVPAFLRPAFSFLARGAAAPRPVVRKAKCIGCGKCAGICPQDIIALPSKKAVISYKKCIRCFCCHEICPVQAIEVRHFPLFTQ